MEIPKKNYSSIIINKYPLSNKNSEKILIPKIYINEPFKRKINKSNSCHIKLPSLKSISTKNTSISKYDMISDFKEFSLYKNNNNSKHNISLNKKRINSFYKNTKTKDSETQYNNKINDYNYKSISQDYHIRKNKPHLKKSLSSLYVENTNKIFSKYKISNIRNFHKNLMLMNKLTYNKKIREKYLEMANDKNNENNSYINSIFEKKKIKKIKTGIFGPNDNIVSVIRAKMERLKYDNIYKGVNDDIKEIIKDEIMDAQVKLKRKPQNLILNKNEIRPLYIRKMDKYRYLSNMNKIREINQVSTIPVLEKDRNIMLKLFNDAFDILRNKISKNN